MEADVRVSWTEEHTGVVTVNVEDARAANALDPDDLVAQAKSQRRSPAQTLDRTTNQLKSIRNLIEG